MGLGFLLALYGTPHVHKQKEELETQREREREFPHHILSLGATSRPAPALSHPTPHSHPWDLSISQLLESKRAGAAAGPEAAPRQTRPLRNECAPMSTLPAGPPPRASCPGFRCMEDSAPSAGPLCGQVHIILSINLTLRLQGSRGGGEGVTGSLEAEGRATWWHRGSL